MEMVRASTGKVLVVTEMLSLGGCMDPPILFRSSLHDASMNANNMGNIV